MEQEIRVLHILTTLVSGGVQSVVLNYAAKMKKYNIVFDYIVQGKGNPEVEKRCMESGSKIYYLPNMMKHPAAFCREFKRFLKQHPEYKIVHSHQNYLNIIPLMCAKKRKVPVRISHSHSYRPPQKKWKELARYFARIWLNNVLTEKWACSEIAYRWLYGKNNKNDIHSYILHNAVDYSKFGFDKNERAKYRKILEVDEKVVCICVGRLSKVKNQQFLLDIFSKLDNEEYVLILVGRGEEESNLRNICKAKNLGKNVILTGDRADIRSLLCASDYFLLPSLYEGLPVSAIEAQVNGIPCILSSTVSKEVKVNKNVFFEDIDNQSEQKWIDRIKECKDLNGREQEVDRLISSGFELDNESEKLAWRYKEMEKNA